MILSVCRLILRGVPHLEHGAVYSAKIVVLSHAHYRFLDEQYSQVTDRGWKSSVLLQLAAESVELALQTTAAEL